MKSPFSNFSSVASTGLESLSFFSHVEKKWQFTNVFFYLYQAREKFEVSDDIKRLNPSDIANAVVYAVTQPAHCAVNEILVEPTDAPC